MAHSRAPTVTILLASAIACGGDDSLGPLGPNPGFEVRTLTQTMVAEAPSRTVTLSGAPEVLGVGADGQPVAGIEGGLWAITGAGPERRRLFAGPGDPVFLGQLRTLSPRPAGGAWLAADAGLFTVDGVFVSAAAPIGPIFDVTEVLDGPLAGLWLCTPTSLVLSLPDEVAVFEIPDATGGYRAFAARPDGTEALAIVGDEALVLLPDGLDLDVRGLPFLTRPRAIAATSDALWLAADEGLFARAGDGAWVRIDGPDGPLLADDLDASASLVFALAARQVLIIDLPRGSMDVLPLDGVSRLAASGGAGFWTARDDLLEGWQLVATSFENDLRPFVETHCVACHGSGSSDYRVYENFAPRAEAALERVRAGDMPRCGVDQTRCPEAQRLQPETYGVLERWIEEGKLR